MTTKQKRWQRQNLVKSMLILISVILVIFMTLVGFWIPADKTLTTQLAATETDSFRVERGVFDLRQWNPEIKPLLSMNGDWEIFTDQLLTPAELSAIQLPNEPQTIPIPAEIMPGKPLSGLDANGYATLRVRVLLPEDERIYGLKFAYFASAYRVWINGKELVSAGTPVTNPAECKPRYLPSELLFHHIDGEVEVVVQVSNFHHRRMRLRPVLLGDSQAVTRLTQRQIISESLIFGSLLVIALYYGVLYLIQRREPALLSLATAAFITAIRGGIIGERIVVRLWPQMPGELMMKLGYLPVFILLPLLVIYVRDVLDSPEMDRAARLSGWGIWGLTAFVALTPVKGYDAVFQYGQGFILLGSIYLIYVMVVYGFRKKNRGAYAMAVGSVVVLLAAASDMLREFSLWNAPELVSEGLMVFIMIQAGFLAWRFNHAFLRANTLATENAAMYEEIQQMNRDLEEKIRQRTLELTNTNRKLMLMSRTDALTGADNRRSFEEKLQKEWHRLQRENRPLALIMSDIDFFKEYNDQFGHPEGDVCLRQVAAAIGKTLRRETDVLARYGGEEFIIMLPNTDKDGACRVAEKIRKNVEALQISHPYSSIHRVITISFGVAAIIPSRKTTPEALVRRADQALYAAKQQGRNCVVLADEQNTFTLKDLQNESENNHQQDFQQDLQKDFQQDFQKGL
ncbi:sensor domain-containing diguanylate cyclase [Anoxynatronum buryatiense]|uniref:Diguanylate cyclase (GGDEF) domain-containing protein n=1 Tax=Anoxynatronum buryatiense TaxID=489973 RepID=A0AA45WWH4_9CLOT|nr:diguanylate cyclase [Anoxynatronum buryatiense]SMP57861.1 diguanylate cyclase (GGDEF) domain-containing protein [Anoxynatronum buryatiense]